MASYMDYIFGRREEKVIRPEHILIIDDDKQLVQKYKEILEKNYQQVDYAYDGEESLEKLKQNGADLVILDIQMPKMDGIKVLETIRDDKSLRKTRVLVKSSHTYKNVFTFWISTFGMIPKLNKTGRKAKYIGESNAGDFERITVEAKPKRGREQICYGGVIRQFDEGKESFQERLETDLLRNVENALRPNPESLDREKKNSEPDRVLIVDDDKQVVARLASLLKQEGYEILFAYNGTEAIEKLAGEDVDLVILDLNMPETSGEEVIRVMNYIPVVNHIPIIVFSSIEDTTTYKDLFGLSPGTEIIDEKNIRSRIRSYNHIAEAYDKPKESKILSCLHMDKPRALLAKVKEQLKERRRLGYGYKKHPITIVRDKHNYWMISYLERYKKINPFKYGGATRKCSYCWEEKMPEYEYDTNHSLQYLCKACAEELKSKYQVFDREQ